ncbi:MAG TPA: flagellar biosynthesis protein FliA, partial [Blastococcus sp.]|nr:flagellar biosynthesis protein FliA [Blastococcus sp.]
MSPARSLATERPTVRPSAQRSTRERPEPNRASAPGVRSPLEVDALVKEHLPLAAFAVNAVAARISLPGHVSREDLVSCAHVALVEVAKRFDPNA